MASAPLIACGGALDRDNSRAEGHNVMMATKYPLEPVALAHLNELLDEALEETFPASDPIAIAVELESSEPGRSPGVELPAAHRRRHGASPVE
jgi:hypothetical protein